MASQRGNRGSLVRISLVGYTNVGKSTIMNLLAKSEVFAENKLFATLDNQLLRLNFRGVEKYPFETLKGRPPKKNGSCSKKGKGWTH